MRNPQRVSLASGPASDAVARPLVVRFGALGDMVLLTVLIRALAQRFGTPVDVVCSGAWSEPLLAAHPEVCTLHRIRSLRMPYLLSWDQRVLVHRLRHRLPGPTWYCDLHDKGRKLLRMAGISDDLIVSAADHPIQNDEHFADYWLRLAHTGLDSASAATAPIPLPAVPMLPVAAAESLAVEQWLQQRSIPSSEIILIQAGNKRTMRRGRLDRRSNSKYWPLERWSTILRGLRTMHPRASILMLGVKAERSLNEAIIRMSGMARLFNVAGELPIGRLLALQARAAGMISVDTGPAHAAAAVGCRMVVLFGKAKPANYAPRGAGALVQCLTGTQDGQPSMLGIGVDDVLDAWRTIKPGWIGPHPSDACNRTVPSSFPIPAQAG